ncbi:TonB-dependent receptor plug domain-containing protein [Polynucleobacter sp. AP-Jannik-300A-C4]|uniref:TonB-dependent receptor n=1 Tax=Polynucleobacter sp. AP-Jannik-300A-C4 TaxID=2576928 RepID=UPI001BFE11F0|nr:TonB-dependent receptor [Polynucleobacter sp. AP-Jannik-300A-C4]QWE23202.1 TonB-dependent receptor plug domain-containing protein [Polynucleobacter sp. AP-Jannik-300A-C4]
MKVLKITPIALVASLMLTNAYGQAAPNLDALTVTGIQEAPLTQTTLTGKGLNQSRVNTPNTAAMILNIPGVSMYTGGGVSGLPAIHGLADDRVAVSVDGMPLLYSCPNHMNSPLSYISPSNVGSVKVITGLSPVSAGGDSLGGVVSVQSLPPVFANKGETLQQGEVGASYSSNAQAIAGNINLTAAGDEFSATYTVDSAKANNYTAGGNFKPAGNGLNGNVVGASRYIATNQQLSLAWQKDNHLVEFKTSYQFVPFEGYSNQRMDMTKNIGTQFNLKYTGQYDWGKLEAQAYNQMVNHQMDDNQGARTTSATNLTPQTAMPMLTASSTNGVDVKGTIPLSETQLARVGGLFQTYKLNDWWPPVAGTMMMSPNTFQNINNGTRDRLGVFGELEQQWAKEWMGLAGVRIEQVASNAGNVQGYSTSAMMYGADANAFNAKQHQQTDYNWDLTALSRYKPDQSQNYEAGYSRKTRSPNLYERYTWSSNSMAAIMNNFVGDGNGYVGQVTLAPEVANTFSFASDWHDVNKELWGFKTNPYYTYVSNYIDATCNSSCTANQFNVLKYVNQDAQLYGIDLSGFTALGKHAQLGKFQLNAQGSYTRGQNVTAGTNLYNIIPLNGTVGLVQFLGANWTNTIQGQFVTAKTNLNSVRNEIATGGYSLFNLRSSYDDKKYRVNFGIENLLNKLYALPQGGAYLGQGPTMTMNNTGGSPWGTAVAGMGRTFYVSANMKF